MTNSMSVLTEYYKSNRYTEQIERQEQREKIKKKQHRRLIKDRKRDKEIQADREFAKKFKRDYRQTWLDENQTEHYLK